MATPLIIDNGDNSYWINGVPAEGIRNPQTQTGSNTYWLNGVPEEYVFALTNQDTGKFFLLFE